MKTKRLQLMEEYINSRDVVTIPELLEKFQISMNTVRRDLSELERKGKIKKIYGGAKRAEPSGNSSDFLIEYAERNNKNAAQKYAIAHKASSFISEDDIIFIDTGTSTVPLFQQLTSFHHLTIVTNSIYVLYSALDVPQFTVIGLPGTLKHKTASLVGEQCVQMIKQYNFSKAFMACSAFSLENGASNSSMEEYTIKREVIARSAERHLLIDASKFNKSSLMSYAAADDFDYVITEQMPDQKYVHYFKEHDIRLVLSGGEAVH